MDRTGDPRWVAAELRRRGLVVFAAGDGFDPKSDDPAEVATALNIPRWARLGGGQPGDVITADMVNRGRLVDAMQREEATRGAQA